MQWQKDGFLISTDNDLLECTVRILTEAVFVMLTY